MTTRQKDKKPIKVALIVPPLFGGDDFKSQLYRGVMLYAREHSSVEINANSWTLSLESPNVSPDELVRQGVKGIMVSGESIDIEEYTRAFRKGGVRFLNMWSDKFPEALQVRPDHREAGRMVARYFLNKGYASFGLVGWDLSKTSPPVLLEVEDRRLGFTEILKARGFSCPEFNYFGSHGENPESDRATAARLRAWILRLPKPVGILAMNDVRGRHVLEACGKLGLEIPAQAAVVGMENNQWICEINTPSLSSVDMNLVRTGYEAAAWMEKVLRGAKPPAAPIIIPPREVVTRNSSDILAVNDPIVSNSVKFILTHLDEPITIAQIARSAGVSSNTLLKHMRQTLAGKTVHEVVLHLRLERAKRFLRTTRLTTHVIAEKCGFRRASYLAHVFETHLGKPPSLWREENRDLL